MRADQCAAGELVVVLVVFSKNFLDCCSASVGFWCDYCRKEVQHEQGHVFLEVPGKY